jgi:hypothetical protein
MRVNYQILDFDLRKAKSAVRAGRIDCLIIGDFSCLNRIELFLDRQFLASLSRLGGQKILQLPLITKENELKRTIALVRRTGNVFDGFSTGDLGIVKVLNDLGHDNIIYTTNVTNKEFSAYLKKTHRVKLVRPLMFKRTFVEETIDFDKDVVVYGNFMINCATFCFHSGDLVENCNYSCTPPKKLIMKNELLHLVGRSLITDNRLDVIDGIGKIKDIRSMTIQDLNLTPDELDSAFERIRRLRR